MMGTLTNTNWNGGDALDEATSKAIDRANINGVFINIEFLKLMLRLDRQFGDAPCLGDASISQG